MESYCHLFLVQILSTFWIHVAKATEEIFRVVEGCVDTAMPVQLHDSQASREQRLGSPPLLVGWGQFSVSWYVQGRRGPCLLH